MPRLQIQRIEIQGFRAFGQKAQTLVFGSPIAAVWGPNSQGKTSLAEAFEFLLTGLIVRRELLASTQDEFADALHNAHMPAATPTFVLADIITPDGAKHTIKRTLTADYGKKQDCRTALEIDGKAAADAALTDLGFVLSQPPLRAPVLAQHTLGYLFSARPQDRATYFKALLEVTDLDAFRASIAALEADLKVAEDPAITKFKSAAAIPEAEVHFMLLQLGIPTKAELEQGISDAAKSLIESAGEVVPAGLPDRVDKVEAILADKRAKAFPVKGFDKKPLPAWAAPAAAQFEALETYAAERAKVGEETRRLTALFREALAIPAVAAAADPIDCPLCGAEESLTSERIAFIAQRLRDTEAYRNAEADALKALAAMATSLETLDKAVTDSLPLFISYPSKLRRARGFRVDRIRELLGPEAATNINAWLAALRMLARSRTALVARARFLRSDLAGYVANLDTLTDPALIRKVFDETTAALAAFVGVLPPYIAAETPVADAIKAVVDAQSKTAGWHDFIDLARDLDGLRAVLIEAAAREAAQKELADALKQIDKGNETVLDDKFQDLSAGVQAWWDLLRPDELSFFSAVKPRPGARRTIDFKAGLSANPDRSDPKLRDVIAVFSQSQLHCLGLALFLARSVHEGTGVIVLDDPILSSDEDYRGYFNTSVLEKLIELGVQVILLTQDQKTWKDLEHRYLHKNIAMFQISLEDPREGSVVRNTADDLTARLAKITTLANGTHPDLRKQAGEELRNAGERFCKEILVRDRIAEGDKGAVISDYDNKTLGELGPKVEPLLAKDASHPGKLRAFRDNLNPAKHDDGIPSQGTLKVALGDLKALKKEYLGN